MSIPLVVLVVRSAVIVTLLIQGGIKYAKHHNSKSDRT